MQDSWLSNKADEIQGFADRNDMKNFYDSLKEVYGPTTWGSSPLLSRDGSTLITDKEKILERWAEHFDSILNCPSTINDEAIDQLPQVPFDEMLDAVPTFEEIWKAIHLLTSSKAPGADSIPTEVYKEGGTALQRNSTSCSSSFGSMRQFHQTLKTLLSSIFTSARETARSVTIIVGSPCSPSQARPWPEFYSTASLHILREVSYQRASVASRKNAGLSTWCSLLDSSKRSVRNIMLPYTLPMLIWPRHLTLSVEMAFGESWQSMDAPRNLLPLYDSFMMTWWLEFKTMVRYPSHSLSQMEWSKDVSLPPPSSALCFLPCWWMLSEILM